MQKIASILFVICISAMLFGQDNGNDKKQKKEKKEGRESIVSYFNFPNKAVRDYTSSDEFIDYEGLEIDTIKIYVFNRLVDAIADNDSLPLMLKDPDKIKQNFNKKIIKNQLLFAEGDTINPTLFADSERNIRTETIFKDALLTVSLNEDSTKAIVSVFIQDNRHWKMIFELSPTALKLGAGFRDFGGVSQVLRFYAQGSLDFNNPYSINAFYRVKNIGGSQISLQTSYTRENLSQNVNLTLNRRFFAYNTNWAGRTSVTLRNEKIGTTEFDKNYNLKYINQDYWLARSFGLKNINQKNKQMRFILSGRITSRTHTQLPLGQDSIYYPNKQFYIGSFGLATRDWYGFKELYLFRQYDYVPKGFNITFLGGYENNQYLGGRWYSGLKANYNRLYPRFGYLQNQINYGGFLQDGDYEQITVQFVNKYFTNEAKLGKLRFRQFISTNATLSYDRPQQELYNVSSGILGLKTNELRATKSMIINLESVFYTPIKWWTSRGSFFLFTDLGFVSQNDYDFLLDNTIYQGYGFGIRFQNLATAIHFMEISFGVYPNGYRVDAPIWNYNLGFYPSRVVDEHNLYEHTVLDDIY